MDGRGCAAGDLNPNLAKLDNILVGQHQDFKVPSNTLFLIISFCQDNWTEDYKYDSRLYTNIYINKLSLS